MDPKEEWRTIPGFSKYEVSNYGWLYSNVKHCLLVLSPDEGGYPRTEITGDDGELHTPRIHVLVAAAFLGPKPDGLTVNHKNGVKYDNRSSNLEYATHSEQTLHAYRTGLKTPIRGDNHSMTKIPDAEIPKIIALYKTGKYSMVAIGKIYGTSKIPIARIIHGRRRTAAEKA